MPIITVAKRFLLKDDKDQMTEYVPGEYDVSDEIASHWYVQPHLKGFEAAPPPRGTAAYAAAELRVAQAARLGGPVAPPQGEVEDPSVVRFAGRALPKEPDQLTGFIDPRTIEPTAKRKG